MGKQMSTTYRLIRRSFNGSESQICPEFSSEDEAAIFYRDTIKINNRFDSFFVVDRHVDGKFKCRALIFGLLRNLEK